MLHIHSVEALVGTPFSSYLKWTRVPCLAFQLLQQDCHPKVLQANDRAKLHFSNRQQVFQPTVSEVISTLYQDYKDIVALKSIETKRMHFKNKSNEYSTTLIHDIHPKTWNIERNMSTKIEIIATARPPSNAAFGCYCMWWLYLCPSPAYCDWKA